MYGQRVMPRRGAARAGQAAHRRPSSAVSPARLLAASLVPLLVAAGCIPTSNGDVSQIDRPADTLSVPELGPSSSSDEVVEGLVADLATTPDDLSFWAFPIDEATCVANGVVGAVGADRLIELGYRAGTPGASLGDLDLEDGERETAIDVVVDCADLREAVAQIMYGSGRLSPTVATCVADGLEGVGQLRPFAAALLGGGPVDVFADDAALATALVVQSSICIPEDALIRAAPRLPEDDPVIDADAPPGVERSPYVGDRPTPTTP